MASPDLIDRALRRFLVLGQAMRRDAETLPVSVAQSAVLSRLRDGPKTVGELAAAEGVRAFCRTSSAIVLSARAQPMERSAALADRVRARSPARSCRSRH